MNMLNLSVQLSQKKEVHAMYEVSIAECPHQVLCYIYIYYILSEFDLKLVLLLGDMSQRPFCGTRGSGVQGQL